MIENSTIEEINDEIAKVEILLKNKVNGGEYKKNTQIAINKEQLVIDTFNKDIDYRKKICNWFNIPYENAKAFKPKGAKQTTEWCNKKNGTKEKNHNPKTDICIRSGENIIRISLKSGKGRLTSSDCYETNAIFLSVLETEKYNGETELKVKVNKIISLMKDIGKKIPIDKNTTKKFLEQQIENGIENEDTEWLKKFNQNKIYIIDIWNNLEKNHSEYINDILYECIRGSHKFGDTIGCADWCLVTGNGKDDVEIKEKFNLIERSIELKDYCMGSLGPTTSIFAWKSGGTGKQIWMRFL